MADDKLRHGGFVVTNVSEWCTHTLGQGIAIDTAGIRPQLLVIDPSIQMEMSLSDTGAGFAQVLPICVQNYAYQADRLDAAMLIVEQPELHLHPGAHGDVADLMVRSTRGDLGWKPAICLIETHSEQFIMRIRRRIAEGLDPNGVALWSLKHQDSQGAEPEALRVVAFDKDGNPDAWPVGVFEEALQDLTEARIAARERGS